MFSETARKVYAMFSPDYLKEFRRWAINKQREAIAQEMKGYKYQTGKNVKLNDLVMEKGGQPIRNVIFTTWRSGSTFLGETLDSHPGTFYHYEPLLHFNIKQVRSGKLAQEGLRVLNQLFNCNYTGLNEFMKYGKTHHWLYSHNSRVWQYCEKSYDVCWDPKFLSDMCRLFPFQSVKTVRMRLRLAKSLLENKKFNIRLLLLIRDPRGTMQSRNHREWCPEDPDCYEPSRLCADMVDDFNYAEKLREQYADRFLSIRYEDMSLSPYESMQKIFKFFRLQYHPRVEKFLSSHTVANAGGVSSTFRDSKTTPFHWRNDFVGNFSLVTDIQGSCEAAMKLWGYESVEDEDELLTFNPLRKPPWPEMLVLNSSKAQEEIYVK
ncbi:Carbohydrate sulfotransferase 4 [Orchesella cincta]|uniref:Carbohydrate sulfotransferase 4 n=1 Tax=Orchesella cincta TaxID=48709 RepID=A0A1D2MXQ9_ORCCI|nr:Carbohydrate sulfotransferase 4 [Orchesella cincta]